jgi:hypothetical protein
LTIQQYEDKEQLMARLQAPCPACAAPVEFKSRTSLVTICPFCTSVVARGDKELEDHGKVADLVDTQSPLKIDAKGKFRGKPFRIVGRVQYEHSAGGVWDEWYAQFPNGKWGWLAEAQGRFYMTFRKKVKDGAWVPPIESLNAGGTVRIGEDDFTVAEVGVAKLGGAEGEIPYDVQPGAEHPFADLYGPDGQFVSLDYGDSPTGYLGWQASLDELGMAGLKAAEKEAKQITAKQLSCPQCAGALELRAPDEAMRVSCPYCSALLDVDHGNLEYLTTLTTKVDPLIELGATGTLFDVKYTIIGFMQRSVTYDRKYYWTEYLLYEPNVGFRWLVNSKDHWSFVEPLSPGDVHDFKSTAAWNGHEFKLFERAIAQVEYVLGEFYWKVEVGEEVTTRDMICPPYMLSVERSLVPPAEDAESGRPNLGELNMSLGTYLPHATVEEAFGVEELPRSFGVAPNQPFPCDRGVYGHWLVFAAALFIIYLGAATMFASADGWLLVWALFFASIIPITAMIVNTTFNVSRWSDSDFSPYSTDD